MYYYVRALYNVQCIYYICMHTCFGFLFHFCVQMSRKTIATPKSNGSEWNGMESELFWKRINIQDVYRNLPLNGRSTQQRVLVANVTFQRCWTECMHFISRVRSMAPHSFHLFECVCTFIKICPSTFCLCVYRFPFRCCH